MTAKKKKGVFSFTILIVIFKDCMSCHVIAQ